MVVTSKLRTHKVMEAAIRELMGAGTPPRFKFQDTYESIEFPSGYTIPAQATLEAKYDELLALEEDIQKTVVEGDLEVGTSNLFVDTETGIVGIGTTGPVAALDINGGAETGTTPVLALRGGLQTESDLYVLNTYGTNTGVGYAAKVIGVNIKNKVETNNTVKLRSNTGGVTSAGAIYLGSDDVNQGIFGVLGGTGATGTTLSEHLTVRASGNVGVGTVSPGQKLEVGHYGGALSSDFGAIRITNHATNLHATSLARFDISLGDIASGTGSGSRKLIFNSKTTTTDSGTDILCLDGLNNNVGIGTGSPGYKLDVHGTSNVGALTATTLSGDGSGLTALNATNISSGTINKDRLPTTLNNTTIGSLAIGANDVTLTAKPDYYGLKIIKAFDHPDEPATLLLAGDGDAADDIAFEVRGNGTGADVDTSITRNSNDTTFGILHTGHTYIGYANLNPGEVGGVAQTGDPMLNVNGDIYAVGNITAYSDKRAKSDIQKIENALDKIDQLNGYTFTMNDKRYTGVIAQEVLPVLPEAVTGSEETNYAVAYGNMMGLIIEAIKELKQKIG